MTSKMVIHGSWLDDTFFLWGEESSKSQFNQVVNFQYPFLSSSFELKLKLFRNDPLSFYGTFIEEQEAVIDIPLVNRQFSSFVGSTIIYQADNEMTEYSFPIEGATLSHEMIMEYIPIFKQWEYENDFELAPDLKVWIQFFKQIQQSILSGAFSPTASGRWELTNFSSTEWVKIFPDSALAVRPSTDVIHTKEKKEQKVNEIATAITDASIRSLISEPEVSHAYVAWQQSIDKKLLPQVKQLSKKGKIEATISNNVFQQKIGVSKTKPFISGLALKEPSTQNGDWTLSLCMIDRERPSFIVEMNQLQFGEHPWRENPIAQLKSDLSVAQETVPLLEPLRLSAPTLYLNADEAYDIFTKYDELLQLSGFQLIVPKWMTNKETPRLTLSMNEQIADTNSTEPLLDWQSVASFTYKIAIGEQTISEDDFAKFVEGKRPFLFADGTWIAWDRSLTTKLQSFIEQIKENTSYLDVWRLNELNDEESDEDFSLDINWSRELTKSMKALHSTPPEGISIPNSLNGELRHYQHEGASWLVHLRRVGFGGCLADDMGLGKSIQTIAYMLHTLEEQKKANIKKPPFLLICPTSLLFNWYNECTQFAPSLRIFIHHGQTRLTEEELQQLDNWDVIITTYQLTVRDASLFQQIKWNGLILDEAQQIKNTDTKQRKMIKKIEATHRLLLTGTPIENRLRELWSLFDVLNPSYLGTLTQFQEQFIKPIERDQNDKQLLKLQSLIRPLILRRQKSDQSLKLGLPEKKEVVHKVHLSVEQAALYQAVVDDIVVRINESSAFERRALILRSLTKLKQICNHPAHFLKANALDQHESGKWMALTEQTDKIVKEEKKVLIFTQYKEMGSLMVNELEKKYGEQVPFLHGSLTRAKRMEAIKAFQEDDSVHIFVLSLKAGGVGLNLTAATNVIHYDRWWNPAVENQATDRAYRIGQTNDVTVHKLITKGTLEERIDQMLTEKQTLADHILKSTNQAVTELTNEELFSLIQLQ